MLKPDTSKSWDSIWIYFDKVDKDRPLKLWEKFDFADALRLCEAAQKDKAIRAYVLERIKQRKMLRRKLLRTVKEKGV